MNKDNVYVGSVHLLGRQVEPEVVIYRSEAYVIDDRPGARAGGIPRYVLARTHVAKTINGTEATN